MSGLLGRWTMSELMPRGVEAKPFPTLYPPVDGAGTEPPPAGPGYDPAAAEAVMRSYRHRLGRPPSLDELRAALGLETDEPVMQPAASGDALSAGFGIIPNANAAPRIKGPQSRPPRVAPEHFGPWSLPALKAEPLLKAQLDTTHAAWELPGLIARMAVDYAAGKSPDSAAAAETLGRIDSALRSQAQAYDWWKSDPNKSYQTYWKEREDLGPCRDSEKLDPSSPCYYAGSTSGRVLPLENILRRFQYHYPTERYKPPELDCITSTYMATRAREQQLIDNFRAFGLSDNVANSVAKNLWWPYFEEMAQRQCGNNPLPTPRPR